MWRRKVLAHSVVGTRVPQWITALKELGYQVDTVPQEVMAMLGMARIRSEARKQSELCAAQYSPKNCQVLVEEEEECRVENSGKVELIPLDQITKRMVLDMLRPDGELFAGVELKNTAAYGVVRYRPGARLVAHTDMMATHTIGAILNIDQRGKF